MLEKLKVDNGVVYFSCLEKKYAIDYMFEESIGTLNQGFTFSYKYLDNTIIEENNLNAY